MADPFDGLSGTAPQTGAGSPFRAGRRRPGGTATFLFAGIEGSAACWERQPVAMGAALARHVALLHAAIGQYGGQVVKMVEDGVHAVFARAPDAVAAAARGVPRREVGWRRDTEAGARR